jgi:hypothetical protein
LRKDGQTTRSINIWSEDGSDIGAEESSMDIRLVVGLQGEIPVETNTFCFEMLVDSWKILRCDYVMEK